MANVKDLIFMEDGEFCRMLLADATEQEKELFFLEFPECRKWEKGYKNPAIFVNCRHKDQPENVFI